MSLYNMITQFSKGNVLQERIRKKQHNEEVGFYQDREDKGQLFENIPCQDFTAIGKLRCSFRKVEANDELQQQKGVIQVISTVNSPIGVGEMNFRSKKLNNSIFHNFQKHIINILKTHLNLKKYEKSSNQCQSICFILWNGFLQCRRPSKKHLYTILKNQPKNISLFHDRYDLPEYRWSFQRVIQNTSNEQFSSAQQLLRLQIYQQGLQMLEADILNERKIKRKRDFRQYFEGFINQVLNSQLPMRWQGGSQKMSSSSSSHNYSIQEMQNA